MNIQERLVLVGLLPEKGNFDTMSAVESLRVKLYPTEKEVKEFEIVQDEKAIRWNQKAVVPVTIDFSDAQTEILKSKFKDLSDKDELSLDQFSLYKKFN